VGDDKFPMAFVVVRGAVHLDDDAPDLRDWTDRIAARYVPDRAEEYGARNAAPGETLVRLHTQGVTGATEVAI
jgi:hypothetical protein